MLGWICVVPAVWDKDKPYYYHHHHHRVCLFSVGSVYGVGLGRSSTLYSVLRMYRRTRIPLSVSSRTCDGVPEYLLSTVMLRFACVEPPRRQTVDPDLVESRSTLIRVSALNGGCSVASPNRFCGSWRASIRYMSYATIPHRNVRDGVEHRVLGT